MHYCDHKPVVFGTRGSLAAFRRWLTRKPTEVAGGKYRLARWPLQKGIYTDGFDSPLFLSETDPVDTRSWRVSFQVFCCSLEPPSLPWDSLATRRCAEKFNRTGGTMSPAFREWVVRFTLTSFSHS
jgi:hypothetical protein